MSIVLITGGSRGIGAACALEAARHGYDVCLNYVRSAEKANVLCDQVQALGQRAVAVAGDVAIENDVTELFDRCSDSLGTPAVRAGSGSPDVGQTGR